MWRLVGRRYVLRETPDRQRQELAVCRANGTDDVAVIVIDLDILHPAQHEDIGVVMRIAADVRRIRPSLAQPRRWQIVGRGCPCHADTDQSKNYDHEPRSFHCGFLSVAPDGRRNLALGICKRRRSRVERTQG